MRPLPRPGRSVRKPFPDWVEYRPGSIWIFDTTHFTRARMAVTVIEDLVGRKWLAEIVSAEETTTQVQVAFTEALEGEGLIDQVAARLDGLVDPTVDDPTRPILLAMSDNGPQMTSGSTREFMALCAIHQHFGRPGTPTDQAWIESLFGHVKAEWPHLTKIGDPATLRAELAVVREHYNRVRLHAGIGYVTPNDEHEGRGERSARPAKPDSSRPGCGASPTIAPTPPPTRPSTPSTTCPRSPAMLQSSTSTWLGAGLQLCLELGTDMRSSRAAPARCCCGADPLFMLPSRRRPRKKNIIRSQPEGPSSSAARHRGAHSSAIACCGH